MFKQTRYTTGEPGYDIVYEFFRPLIERYNLTHENAIIQYHNYESTDNSMAHLVVNDILKAVVIERRTDFNNIEFTFIDLF